MITPRDLYTLASKYYLITPAAFFVPYFFIDAPFGRFSPSKSSRLVFDGIKSWIVMEIVSPICFLATFFSSPLTRPVSSLKRFPLSPPPILTYTSYASFRFAVPNTTTILIILFLVHYANRALISPLRTPSRSKSHVAVPIFGIVFNIVNGSLMGAFLAAIANPIGKSGFGALWSRGDKSVVASWSFWVGVSTWALGFASNIWHDEILLNIRRKSGPTVPEKKPLARGKGKEKPANSEKPHYAIPRGGLYTLVSYPNYFSEWAEWFGFAIAASSLTAQLPGGHVAFPFAAGRLGDLSNLSWVRFLTPPWLFFLSEVFLMFPRAWNGHKWYHKTFPDYPRERKAVIPFLL